MLDPFLHLPARKKGDPSAEGREVHTHWYIRAINIRKICITKYTALGVLGVLMRNKYTKYVQCQISPYLNDAIWNAIGDGAFVANLISFQRRQVQVETHLLAALLEFQSFHSLLQGLATFALTHYCNIIESSGDVMEWLG